MASTYLTNGLTAGSGTIGTVSLWVKRASLGTSTLYQFYEDNQTYCRFRFDSSDVLHWQTYDNNTSYGKFKTNRVFRDTSAWYHIVVRVDTTQSTEADRFKLYVNGSEETSFSTSTYPTQNRDVKMTAQPYIGTEWTGSGSNYFDGNMTHIHYTDGQSYAASTFGESDSTSGIWKPKTAPSVTYGSKGFFLKMENSGAMGTDSSGNGNNFTVSGTLTQNVDTPSNNFATMNPIDVSGNPAPPTFANGNLSVDAVSVSQNATARSTLAVSSGKWYVEAKQVGTASPEFMRIGIIGADSSTYVTSNTALPFHTTGYAYKSSNGYKGNNSTESSYGDSYTNGDIIGIAFDADNGTIWFSKNGTWQNSATQSEIEAGTTTNSAFSGISMTRDFMFGSSMGGATSGLKYEWNFGSGFFGTTAVASANADANGHGAMEYAVPSGYYTLNTKNLKEFG